MTPRNRLLVIDDEPEFLNLIRSTLELRGFEVVTVTSAVEAGLELATKPPDLILMDIKMPGINGIEACEAIRRNPATKGLPIIIVSALSDESDKKKAYACGVLDYFVKPVDMEALVRRIQEALSTTGK